MSEPPTAGGRPPFDRTRFINRFVFGLVMLTLGVLWTLDNLAVVEAGKILAWWPAATLAWGLMLLFGVLVNRCRTLGAIWIGIGLIGGLDALHLGRFSALDLFPLFLVVIGGLVVVRAWRRRAFADGGGGLFGGPRGAGPGRGVPGGGAGGGA